MPLRQWQKIQEMLRRLNQGPFFYFLYPNAFAIFIQSLPQNWEMRMRNANGTSLRVYAQAKLMLNGEIMIALSNITG